ncbi:MATE family efflux transporter [Siculibacillus lacustris]|uniref:MATE family efflux transporter n=1 Tax=Siculibacillus lacustris TaxID=1549641 RepID=A0A4Q9VNC5_9HYPH|nr:MATE family efflux transporter [Siculibacillus lacustris]TBW37158.1 MATE family efflux transporter [Siculibacillus lacustris]
MRAAPIGHREVLAIAVPMTLGYVTTPLVGLVATAVIGRLGDPAALGGVALGSILCDLVFCTFNFLRSGTTGLTAQASGRADGREVRAVLLRALVTATLCGLAIVVLAAPIVDLGVAFVGGGPAVERATRTYARIRLWAAPLVLGNYAVFGWLLGLGRASVGLVLQTVVNGVNIAGAVLLVSGLGLGVAGVATAGVIAEGLALALGLTVVAVGGRRARWPSWREVLHGPSLFAMATLNRDIMIRSFALLGAFVWFSRQSAGLGEVILAANAILEKFFLLAGYFLDGLAAAAETFVGRAVGAGDRPAFDRAVRLTLGWSAGLAAFAALVVIAGGGTLIDWMTTSPPVVAAAHRYLPWAAATPLAAVLAFQMDGVFIGATWSRDMARMMVLSLAVYLAAVALLVPAFGNHGLWAAFLGFLGARGVSLTWMMGRRAAEIGDADPVGVTSSGRR